MRKKQKEKIIKYGIIGIFLLAVLMMFLSNAGFKFPFSVFSVDKISTSIEGGKVYWVVYASASNIDEQYDFVKKFSAYTYPDGKKVTPQKQMAVLITEKDSSCNYGLIDLNNGITGLSNPSKNIDLLVLDANSGKSDILEGERADSVTIQDQDGKGELIVTSEGLLEQDSRCPDYENVAIIGGKVVYKDEVLQRQAECKISLNFINIFNCLLSSLQGFEENTQFTSAFDSYDLTSTSFTGRGLDLGVATFTIKADEDYFDSAIYTPAKDCSPEITNIFVPSQVTQGESASMRVEIKNNNDNDCKVTIVPISNGVFFSPNSRDLTLTSNRISTTFTMSNSNVIGQKNIAVEVCFVGFTGKICDSMQSSFNSIEKSVFNPPVGYCTDGICQSSESYTTCPQDCKVIEEICGNGLDDDSDGKIDLEDEDCQFTLKCDSCDEYVKIKLFGWFTKEQECERTFAQKLSGCIGSWIKAIFLFILVIFLPLLTFPVFDVLLKNIVSNKTAKMITAGVFSLGVTAGAFFLFLNLLSNLSIIVFIILVVAVLVFSSAIRIFAAGKVNKLKKVVGSNVGRVLG